MVLPDVSGTPANTCIRDENHSRDLGHEIICCQINKAAIGSNAAPRSDIRQELPLFCGDEKGRTGRGTREGTEQPEPRIACSQRQLPLSRAIPFAVQVSSAS
jgi:hypothetical protein